MLINPTFSNTAIRQPPLNIMRFCSVKVEHRYGASADINYVVLGRKLVETLLPSKQLVWNPLTMASLIGTAQHHWFRPFFYNRIESICL